ncbi:MAG: sigma-70 family RNA polymerase sigma factor [Flavobacteriaceae bacterium]|nr:sigma-70 family RNA polymerase sigma factor [Flavobacteriaceae bacterium]
MQAQMEVYERYHQAMFATALKIVHNKMDAEDIMQESFLIAFNRIDQYKGENNFGGWLKKIIIRKSIQHHRDQKRELKLVEELKTQTHDEPFNETKSPATKSF